MASHIDLLRTLMGTDVTPVRKNILIEESDYKSPLSEAYGQKVASSINFINNYQNKAFDFKFLGPFKPLSIPEDGSKTELFDYEIVGISGMLFNTGTAGTTEMDIETYTNGVSNGSILSTTLSILSSSPVAQFYVDLLTPANSSTTGVTLPVFSTTELNAGDAIAPKLISNATGANNLIVNVHYRPR